MMPNTSVLTNFHSSLDVNNQKESTMTTNNLSHEHSSSSLHKQPEVLKSFNCSLDDISQPKEKLDAKIIDLEGFFKGDKLATEHAAHLLRLACLEHGFFQVINHGIDPKLIDEAYNHVNDFFKLPTAHKIKVLQKPGSGGGFSSNLPWKETLTFPYHANDSNSMVVHDFIMSALGNEWASMGMVYQKYCEAMNNLCLAIMELLAISLGVERSYYKDFFEDARSVLRLNYYPPCGEPSLALGIGPHSDPNLLTIIYQDQVGGLEVFANNKWQSVEPRPDALVINIGDTFMALSNGQYRSCLHRIVSNENKERKSVGFFLNPIEDKVIRPPEVISKPRKYPDFTWSEFVEYTRKYYHLGTDDKTFQISFMEKHNSSDVKTLQGFLDSFFTGNPKSIP